MIEKSLNLSESEEKRLKQQLVYTFDLSRIQGNKEIKCPKCGAILSPDDKTENVYCILETKVRDNHLEELVIQCQRCRSKIRLIGFSILNIVDS
jgi:DNA-directed RNA polymerase subunit RPC12/RpoP